MADYNFQLLQPTEFENLARDILQVKEGIYIQSYADGKDRGIDFRYSTNKDKNIVVQVKRYRDSQTMLRKLENEELPKVKQLNPDRYIIICSVDLTRQKKEELKSAFIPYIKDTEDIICEKDLNNLLGSDKYKDVIHKNPKLWLASVNVLNEILNKKVLNWSDFTLQKIEKDVKNYVMNPSFNNALSTLKEYHYVIISGIPGIGKTTLARMLVYYLLNAGVKEFIYINKDIDDAVQMYDKNITQVFFYDDFLGQTYFDSNSHLDKELDSFIDNIRKTGNKYLIMTTREYILNDASSRMENFNTKNRTIAKTVIELEQYNNLVRAKILRNHLYDSDIPHEYLRKMLEDKSYMDIITHDNFNPRIIEAFINNRIWESDDIEDFKQAMLNFFDKPLCVWQYAYNKLSELSKSILMVLATTGNCSIDDLEKAVEKYAQANALRYNEDEWRSNIKILSNCFICSEKLGNLLIIKFHNPSISDFMISHFEKSPKTVRLLLENSYFSEQSYKLFTDCQSESSGYKGKIVLDASYDNTLSNLFDRILTEKKSCGIGSVNNVYERDKFDKIKFLANIRRSYTTFCKKKLFIETHLQLDDLDSYGEKYSYKCELLKNIDWNKMISFTQNDALVILDKNKRTVPEFAEYVEVYNYLLGNYKPNSEFLQSLEKCLELQIDNINRDDFNEIVAIINCISSLKRLMPDWDAKPFTDILEKQQKEIEDYNDELIDEYLDSEEARLDFMNQEKEYANITYEMETLWDKLKE